MSVAPQLSLVVIVYNMAREARRTLLSLTPGYQAVDEQIYEVIVVDNGSDPPLGEETVKSFGVNYRYELISSASPSPAAAVNFGAALARADCLGIMIDGARLLSPGVLKGAIQAFRSQASPLITTLGFHLGKQSQQVSISRGYDAAAEDTLLASINWPEDGYRLFEISSLGLSGAGGWHGPITESNCLFLSRRSFDSVGGYDERFDLPGGGLVNLDFFRRASAQCGHDELRLMNEASFHQIHGGVSTNVSSRRNKKLWKRYSRQYRRLRGFHYQAPQNRIEPIVYT